MAEHDRFYETHLTLVVLSREPIERMEVADVLRECDEGDMVLATIQTDADELTRTQMERRLDEFGSSFDIWNTDLG